MRIGPQRRLLAQPPLDLTANRPADLGTAIRALGQAEEPATRGARRDAAATRHEDGVGAERALPGRVRRDLEPHRGRRPEAA